MQRRYGQQRRESNINEGRNINAHVQSRKRLKGRQASIKGLKRPLIIPIKKDVCKPMEMTAYALL